MVGNDAIPRRVEAYHYWMTVLKTLLLVLLDIVLLPLVLLLSVSLPGRSKAVRQAYWKDVCRKSPQYKEDNRDPPEAKEYYFFTLCHNAALQLVDLVLIPITLFVLIGGFWRANPLRLAIWRELFNAEEWAVPQPYRHRHYYPTLFCTLTVILVDFICFPMLVVVRISHMWNRDRRLYDACGPNSPGQLRNICIASIKCFKFI